MAVAMEVSPPNDLEERDFVLTVRIERESFYQAAYRLRKRSVFDAGVLDECAESGKPSDALLALEMIVREVERMEAESDDEEATEKE